MAFCCNWGAIILSGSKYEEVARPASTKNPTLEKHVKTSALIDITSTVWCALKRLHNTACAWFAFWCKSSDMHVTTPFSRLNTASHHVSQFTHTQRGQHFQSNGPHNYICDACLNCVTVSCQGRSFPLLSCITYCPSSDDHFSPNDASIYVISQRVAPIVSVVHRQPSVRFLYVFFTKTTIPPGDT